jgi:hypothetical protein
MQSQYGENGIGFQTLTNDLGVRNRDHLLGISIPFQHLAIYLEDDVSIHNTPLHEHVSVE